MLALGAGIYVSLHFPSHPAWQIYLALSRGCTQPYYVDGRTTHSRRYVPLTRTDSDGLKHTQAPGSIHTKHEFRDPEPSSSLVGAHAFLTYQRQRTPNMVKKITTPWKPLSKRALGYDYILNPQCRREIKRKVCI